MDINLDTKELTLTADGNLEELFISAVLDINNHKDGVVLFKNVYNDKTSDRVPTSLKTSKRYSLKTLVSNIKLKFKLKEHIELESTSKGLKTNSPVVINRVAKVLFHELVAKDLIEIKQTLGELTIEVKIFNNNY